MSGTFALADTAPGTISLVAEFSADPLSGAAPLEVTFTDLSTGTPGSDSWTWDFGDTTGSGDQHPVHIYSSPGIYTVTLTVSNVFNSDDEVKVAYITVLDLEKLYLPLITR
jgi:PKD repeat protein